MMRVLFAEEALFVSGGADEPKDNWDKEVQGTQDSSNVWDSVRSTLNEVATALQTVVSDCANGAAVGGVVGGGIGAAAAGVGAGPGAAAGAAFGCTANVGIGLIRTATPK